MASVTGSFSVNVKPGVVPPPALALNPSTGALPDETEGVALPVAGDLVAQVSGGVPPYTFAITGLPAGVNAAENPPNADGSVDIVLEGTPAAGSASGSPYTVGVVVTDAGPAAASARRPLSVRQAVS